MGWARLDDGFHDHPKLIGLPLDAVGLYTVCLTWALRHRGASSDALVRIPADLPARFAAADGRRLATMLESHRLWDRELDLGGWRVTPQEFWSIESNRARIPAHVRSFVFARDGWRCLSCGTTDDLTLDHVQPWSRGGPDTTGNLRALCRRCNSRKGARV